MGRDDTSVYYPIQSKSWNKKTKEERWGKGDQKSNQVIDKWEQKKVTK
jgi:hypothetical protein